MYFLHRIIFTKLKYAFQILNVRGRYFFLPTILAFVHKHKQTNNSLLFLSLLICHLIQAEDCAAIVFFRTVLTCWVLYCMYHIIRSFSYGTKSPEMICCEIVIKDHTDSN